MIPAEILRKIRRIQITTAKKATDIFAGEYKSVFKGRGMEFVEVREYLPGDEIRSIDWNVTARMGRPFIKKFVEERELTIMLLLDVSGSNRFGSVNHLKRDLAAEVCAVLAASAIKNNDKVGLLVFTDRIERYLPPRKGTKHVFKIIREALYFKPQGIGTNISLSLEYLSRLTKKSTVTFLISDFQDKGLKKPLSIAGKKHDLVAVQIIDPRERELPDAGIIELKDPESGRAYYLDTSDINIREKYREQADEMERRRKKLFYSVNIDRIIVDTSKPYEAALVDFFTHRKQKRGL
ncbi:MAG: DUF58 domain-containing protein [Candidatus Omnitrophica bacterium]|nr:DUF58 domain-containing protein [Candidatus Omnitrophota bacterium]MDD5488683.1 DUF58 domain-containing protein [Candidatus Omnitrophota bacterium]